MVENGTGEHETVRKSHREADGNPVAQIAQHAARGGTVEINRFANAREQRGDDVRLAIDGKAHVTNESFIEGFVNGFSVVDATMRLAHHARALGWRNGFGHDSPH